MSDSIIKIIVVLVILIVVLIIFNKVTHYHKKGEAVDERVIAQYGTPEKSLYISTSWYSLSQKSQIVDNNDQIVYTTKSKIISIHDKTWIYDAQGNQVAYIWKKFFTLHERRFVEMADGTNFQLSNELFHIIKDITNIEGLGWKMKGNIMGMNFTIEDENEKVLASIGQALISINDKYSIDIYDSSKEKYIVAILVGLQHMMRERAAAAAAASSAAVSSSSSSSSN